MLRGASCTTRNPISKSAVTHGRPGIIYYCPRSRPFDFRNVGLHLLVCPRGAGLLLLLVSPAAPRSRRRRWFALPLMNAWHAGPTFKFLVSPGSATHTSGGIGSPQFFPGPTHTGGCCPALLWLHVPISGVVTVLTVASLQGREVPYSCRSSDGAHLTRA